jgi:hypothetical protein
VRKAEARERKSRRERGERSNFASKRLYIKEQM